jgi:C-terminal processing protease CtpA/Prc
MGHLFDEDGEGAGRGGYLGVELAELTDQLRAYFGVSGSRGVLISRVEDKSAAAKAGLRAGDILTKVGDEEVESVGEARRAIRAHEPGSKVRLSVTRERISRTFVVTLARTPRNRQAGDDLFDRNDLEGLRREIRRQMQDGEGRMRVYRLPRETTEDTQRLRDDVRQLEDRIARLERQIEELRSRVGSER